MCILLYILYSCHGDPQAPAIWKTKTGLFLLYQVMFIVMHRYTDIYRHVNIVPRRLKPPYYIKKRQKLRFNQIKHIASMTKLHINKSTCCEIYLPCHLAYSIRDFILLEVNTFAYSRSCQQMKVKYSVVNLSLRKISILILNREKLKKTQVSLAVNLSRINLWISRAILY